MNNTTIDICPDRIWYLNAGHIAEMVVFDALTPVYGVVALLGHLLCAYAFYKQSQNENAYMYQIYNTLSEIYVVLAALLYVITGTKLASIANPNYKGPIWYRSCYPCMWWSCYLCLLFQNGSVTTSELFTVAMSADRFFALWKPFVYKNINAKRHQITAAVLCVLLGMSSAVYICFRTILEQYEDEGVTVYKIVPNPTFVGSIPGKFLSQVQSLIRLIGMILLYVCNMGLLYMYHIRVSEAKKMMNTNDSSDRKKKNDAERTLTLLTMAQSSCVTVCTTCQVVYWSMNFIDPNFFACKGSLGAPLISAVVELMGLGDFLSLVIISKQFRKMLIEPLKCGSKTTNTIAASRITGNTRAAWN